MVEFLEHFNDKVFAMGVRHYPEEGGLKQEFNTDTKQAIGHVFYSNGEINADATAQKMADNAVDNNQTFETSNNPGFNFNGGGVA